jgi:hypothetical protein
MKGTIRFQYDTVHDIHIAHARWTIETEDDCKLWAQQFVQYFTPLGKRVDVIFTCDEFRIGKGIGQGYRQRLGALPRRHQQAVHALLGARARRREGGDVHGHERRAPQLGGRRGL